MYQGLNENSRKNFKQIFAMSGSPIKFNSKKNSNNNTDIIISLAKQIGKNIRNQREFIEFIENVNANDLLDYTAGSDDAGLTFGSPWGPILESIII